MEVTKTVRCMLIGLTRRKSCSGDNLQHWKQERIKYSAYKMRGGYKKAKKMRSNEDLIDREETLKRPNTRIGNVWLKLHLLISLLMREVCDVMMENSTFTVKKDVELKREYASIIA